VTSKAVGNVLVILSEIKFVFEDKTDEPVNARLQEDLWSLSVQNKTTLIDASD
jgi:hypothetical protein